MSTVQALSGQAWPLAVGLVSALWGGLSVVRATQAALNSAWEVPYRERSKAAGQVLRSLAVLATIGLGLVASVLITGYVTGAATGVRLGWAGRLAGQVVAIALDVGLFIAVFRVLADRKATTRQVLPGALLSGVSFWVLQSASSLIISRYLHRAQGAYGNLATVVTILWWFYLQSMITLLGAQVNVVLTERLYPRSLTAKAAAGVTDADRRAYRAYARERAYHPGERVEAEVRGDRDGRDGGR